MKYFLLFALPMLALLASCDDKINLNLKTSTPYVVVDGTIDDQASTVDTLRLSTTIGYLEQGALPPVVNASVLLLGTDGTRDTLTEVRPGKYLPNAGWAGVPGQTYTLRIKLAGGDSLLAAATMPRPQKVDSLTATFKKDKPPFDDGYYVGIWLTEIAGRGDNFTFEITRNDTLQNLPQELFATNDDFTDGQLITGPELNGRTAYNKNDTVTVSMCSITLDAFYFYTELAVQSNNGGLFSQPPANVRTNVVNLTPGSKLRPIGYFLVKTRSTKGIRIK